MQNLVERLDTHEKIGGSRLYGLVGEINTSGYDMLSRGMKRSGFRPAKKFGIGGGGIARGIRKTPFIERYRPPHRHKPYGNHTNGHIILPYGRKKKKIITNMHIR